MNKTASLVAHLDTLCKAHDWTYCMSDDGRVWDRGHRESMKIARLVREIADDRLTDPILDRYCGGTTTTTGEAR